VDSLNLGGETRALTVVSRNVVLYSDFPVPYPCPKYLSHDAIMKNVCFVAM
jgi:hypothetical protein